MESPDQDNPLLDETIARRPEAKSLGTVVLKGSLWLTGGRFVRVGATIITLAILARLISPSEFGVVATAGLANAFVQTVMEGWLGLSALRQRELPKAAMQSQVWVTTLIALGLTLVTCAAAPFVERALDFPGLGLALIALTPLYFAHVYIAASTALLQRQYRFRAAAAAPILCHLFGYAIPAVVMALAGMGMWAIIWAQVISLVATAIILIVLSRLPLGWPKRFDFQSLGAASMAGAIYRTLFWFSVNADTMAVAAYLGPSVTGLYTRAFNIYVQVKAPFLSIQLTLRQALAAIEDERARAQEGLIRALRLAGIGAFLVGAFMASAAEPVTGVLLGPDWLAAAPMMTAFFLGFPARVALLMLDSASMALGHVWDLAARQLGLVLFVVAGALIAVRHGPVAVASVVAAAFWIGFLVSAWLVARRSSISGWAILRSQLPGLALGLGLAVVLAGVQHLLPASAWARALGAGLVTALVGGVVGLAMPEDWLGGSLKKVRRRVLRLIPGQAR